MSHHLAPHPGAESDTPTIVDGELSSLDDVMPTPLRYPPAVRRTCACGKDGTPYSHGATETMPPFSCREVLEIAARVEADIQRANRRRKLAANVEPGRFRSAWRRTLRRTYGGAR